MEKEWYSIRDTPSYAENSPREPVLERPQRYVTVHGFP